MNRRAREREKEKRRERESKRQSVEKCSIMNERQVEDLA